MRAWKKPNASGMRSSRQNRSSGRHSPELIDTATASMLSPRASRKAETVSIAATCC